MTSIDPPIGVITALRDELRPILERMSGPRMDRLDRLDGRFHGLRVWRGSLGGKSVALACAGSGNRNADVLSSAFLERVRPSVLIGAGVSGALTPDLAPGDVVFGERVFGTARQAVPPSDPAWIRRALAAGGAAAFILTGDRIVCAPAERRACLRFVPEGRPAAVDLETSFWARAAAKRGVPFLALRAISDPAEDELPALLAQCQEPGGAIPSTRIAFRAFYRPLLLRRLLLLRGRVRAASVRLAAILETLLAGLEVR